MSLMLTKEHENVTYPSLFRTQSRFNGTRRRKSEVRRDNLGTFQIQKLFCVLRYIKIYIPGNPLSKKSSGSTRQKYI